MTNEDFKLTEKVDIAPGESRELIIPVGLIEEAKRQGKKKAFLRIKYDKNGKEHEQVFEINLETLDIKEIVIDDE